MLPPIAAHQLPSPKIDTNQTQPQAQRNTKRTSNHRKAASALLSTQLPSNNNNTNNNNNNTRLSRSTSRPTITTPSQTQMAHERLPVQLPAPPPPLVVPSTPTPPPQQQPQQQQQQQPQQQQQQQQPQQPQQQQPQQQAATPQLPRDSNYGQLTLAPKQQQPPRPQQRPQQKQQLQQPGGNDSNSPTPYVSLDILPPHVSTPTGILSKYKQAAYYSQHFLSMIDEAYSVLPNTLTPTSIEPQRDLNYVELPSENGTPANNTDTDNTYVPLPTMNQLPDRNSMLPPPLAVDSTLGMIDQSDEQPAYTNTPARYLNNEPPTQYTNIVPSTTGLPPRPRLNK
jgi:hypothetical protein